MTYNKGKSIHINPKWTQVLESVHKDAVMTTVPALLRFRY